MKVVPWLFAAVVVIAAGIHRAPVVNLRRSGVGQTRPNVTAPAPSVPEVPRVPFRPGARRDESMWRMLTEELQYARDEADRLAKDLEVLEEAVITQVRGKKQLEEILAGLQTPGGMASNAPPLKAIEGRVSSVGDGCTVLSIGASDGVEDGNEFTIYRDGGFVAKIAVNRVEAAWCSGRVTLMKEVPRVGDDASNSIFVTTPSK